MAIDKGTIEKRIGELSAMEAQLKREIQELMAQGEQKNADLNAVKGAMQQAQIFLAMLNDEEKKEAANGPSA